MLVARPKIQRLEEQRQDDELERREREQAD